MVWNAFSSFFQLSAAFCLTYTVIETFTANFNKKIYEVDNYFLTDVLTDFERERTEDYRWLLTKKFSSLGTNDRIFDPLANEVKSIIDRHKAMFFHSFISCILFLIFAAFESFYEHSINIDQKICGLIIIPFSSLLFFLMLLQPVKKQTKVDAELKDWKNVVEPKLESYSLSLKIHAVSLILGLIIIYFIPLQSELFFSHTKCKLVVLFCMLSIFIPFVTQFFQIKWTVDRYETAASQLRQANPISLDADMQKMHEKIKGLIKNPDVKKDN